jgi:hypothetical protein
MAEDVMRQEYKPLSAADSQLVLRVKDAGAAFWNLLDHEDTSRELSIAKTKIEEAVMWATKHVTR